MISNQNGLIKLISIRKKYQNIGAFSYRNARMIDNLDGLIGIRKEFWNIGFLIEMLE